MESLVWEKRSVSNDLLHAALGASLVVPAGGESNGVSIGLALRSAGRGNNCRENKAISAMVRALASHAVHKVWVRKCWPRICCTQPRIMPIERPPR